MADCRHCWHDEPHALRATIPQVCCWCGEQRTRMLQDGVPVVPHGDYRPPIQYTWNSKGDVLRISGAGPQWVSQAMTEPAGSTESPVKVNSETNREK